MRAGGSARRPFFADAADGGLGGISSRLPAALRRASANRTEHRPAYQMASAAMRIAAGAAARAARPSVCARAASVAAAPGHLCPSLPRAMSSAAAEPADAASAGAGDSAPFVPGTSGEPRRKYPSRFRRARSMLLDVMGDSLDKTQARLKKMRPELPAWNVGDAVEIEYAFERGDAAPAVIRGSIVGRRRKGLDSSFVLKNEMGDDVITARIPVMSPLLRSMRVMRRNHVRGGKRVRRAQLTYLEQRPVSDFRVTVDTKEEWEHALEAKIRRELQRSGRNWGSKSVAEEKAKIFKTGKGVVRVDAGMDFSKAEVARASVAAKAKRAGAGAASGKAAKGGAPRK